jgi:hypothetical protein
MEAEWLLSSDSLAQMTSVAAHPGLSFAAVLDAVTGLILLFDVETGEAIRYVGGKGDGPGRINCGSALALGDSSIFVLDQCRNRIMELSHDGSERGHLAPWLGPATLQTYTRFVPLDTGVVVARTISALKAPESAAWIRMATHELVFATDTSARLITEAQSAWINVARSGTPFVVPSPFTPRLVWDLRLSDRLVAVSHDPAFVIHFFSETADLHRTVSVPFIPRRVDADARKRLINGYERQLRSHRGIDLSRVVFPRRMPAIRAMRFDPIGALWIWVNEERQESTEDSVMIALWHEHRQRLSWFRFSCFPVIFLNEGRFVCRETDSLGVERLRSYRVRLKAASETF